ncbi:macrophage mannose receptor 1-like isoform X3 [Choristoneura fumiferana]|uniref:macrophage mannose receptor 1-like isoform X3 n=1 Tax=Choristoneura fumiferana TaxID=7141 RepID=UPI003D159777
MFNTLFSLLLFVFVTESTRDTYEHVPSVGRYIKVHRIPANWQDAQFRCRLEGGILASPENKDMFDAMLTIMNDRKISKVYTGIHATFSKGDYTTITGTPLSELDVGWMQGEPDNLNNEEDCLVMYSSGGLSDVKCTNVYPFICHKSPEMMDAHKCSYSQNGTTSSDYVLYNKTLSCYKFHKEGLFWPNAFRTCLAEDAYLAIINSEDESQFLKELFAQHPRQHIPGHFNKDSASIGFRRSDNDHESFVTIHDYVLSNITTSCYKFHKEGLFWPDAYKTCQAEGANLAIINSEAESQVLKELFAQNPPQDIPGDFFKGSASIGFRRSVDSQESFVTIDGQSLTEAGFKTFSDGEPNNMGNNKKCGSVMRNGLLDDHNCTERLAFICEKLVVPKFNLRSNN